MSVSHPLLRPLLALVVAIASTLWQTPAHAATPSAAETSECLQELEARGVDFVALHKSRGVRMPVQIEGPIAGVVYRPTTSLPLIVDCRFALILAEVAPVLRRNGVQAVDFSNAHFYRSTRWGKLSLHANGLALDIHRVTLDSGEELSVQDHFRRRLGRRGCSEAAPALNRIACDLRATRLFGELLTPDYNGEHRDHFHLGVTRESLRAGVMNRISKRSAPTISRQS
jgi:hypothetical protein